jgi:hypothetical protein
LQGLFDASVLILGGEYDRGRRDPVEPAGFVRVTWPLHKVRRKHSGRSCNREVRKALTGRESMERRKRDGQEIFKRCLEEGRDLGNGRARKFTLFVGCAVLVIRAERG